MGTRSCATLPPLLGHTVGVTGHRRSDELAAHLRSLGAGVLLGPTVQVRPVTDELEPLRATTQSIIDEPPDVVVATTGIGIRSWVNTAAAWGLRPALVDALGRARILARGPKVVGSLSELGLTSWHTGTAGRTDELVDHLCATGLGGARVAVVLPGAGLPDVVQRLRDAGAAAVVAVRVYDWQWPDDLEPPRRLLRAVADGRVDAVTFTSRPAVRNLLGLATREGLHEQVVRALRSRAPAICVGQATADELEALTGAAPSVPPVHVLGMIAQQTVLELRRRGHRHVHTATGTDVVVQGRVVAGGGVQVTMSDREAALLHGLLAVPRATVHRDELLRAVWPGDGVEPSVLETTMARLRRRLARTGLTVLTITSRGYLLGGDVRHCPHEPVGAVLSASPGG